MEKLNAVEARLEDLVDENRLLRRKAGIPESEALDLGDVKLLKVCNLESGTPYSSQQAVLLVY